MVHIVQKIAIVALALFAGGSALAQGNGAFSVESVTGSYSGNRLGTQEPITFFIRMNNTTGRTIQGAANGFQIYSSDGAQWDTTIGTDIYGLGPDSSGPFCGGFFINNASITGSGADSVGFAGFYFPLSCDGLPVGFNEVVYTIDIGPLDTAYHGLTICLDSAFFFPTGTWK